MDGKPNVYVIRNRFLVFNKEHALLLRTCRVVGQLIGCSPANPHQLNDSGLPYQLSHYSAALILEKSLANFRKLQPKVSQSIGENESKYKGKISKLIDQSREQFQKRRAQELRARQIEVTLDQLKGFDTTKTRMTVSDLPDEELSYMVSLSMSDDEVRACISVDCDKMLLFNDLYKRKLYVSSGFKFGCDFLAYEGDPIRYHAKYAIRLVPGRSDGFVDLDCTSFSLINAQSRLCYTSNKIPLLVTAHDKSLKYWLLREKVYLVPDSKSEDLIPFVTTSESVESFGFPEVSYSRELKQDDYVVKKTPRWQ